MVRFCLPACKMRDMICVPWWGIVIGVIGTPLVMAAVYIALIVAGMAGRGPLRWRG